MTDGIDNTPNPRGVDASFTQLQRASATLTNGVCGSFGAFANIGGLNPPSPFNDASVVTNTCYMYRYMVPDVAGNVATFVSASQAKVDNTPPSVALTQVNGANRTFPYSTSQTVTSVAGTCSSADLATITVSVTGNGAQSGTATCSSGSWTRTLATLIDLMAPRP